MPIPDALMNFEGYGGRGRIMFIGIEERRRGADPNHLEARLTFPARIDLREACDRIFGPDWWGEPVHQRNVPVWSIAAEFLAELWGVYYEGRTLLIRDRVLGRTGGETLLSELLPVPLPESGVWGPDEIEMTGQRYYPDYRTEMLGYRAGVGPRTELLRRVIRDDAPEYVFCYGISHLNHFKRLFPDLRLSVCRR